MGGIPGLEDERVMFVIDFTKHLSASSLIEDILRSFDIQNTEIVKT